MNNASPLYLDRCTKDRCMQCDIGYIISRYITPLMQCLTNDIKDYNMGLLTTKCLNTAVMIMFFMLGARGLQKASTCDSRLVIQKHTNSNVTKRETNKDVYSKMRAKILRKKASSRELYYILMNDNSFPYPAALNKEDAFFPGHVFILEKIPGNPEPFYYMYQSYINEYDLNGHLERHKKTLRMTYAETKALMSKIGYIVGVTRDYARPRPLTWDENCVQFWKDFTFVDTSDILGSITENHLFICCASSKVKGCVKNIEKYVTDKEREVREKAQSQPDEKYGDMSMYYKKELALSNIEMHTRLRQLLKDIADHKKKLSV